MIDQPEFIPLAALYAEIHYRFRHFRFSRYFRKEPEIIFDSPHRLEPGKLLPVTLIVKDAHRFPINLELIEIKVTPPPRSPGEFLSTPPPRSPGGNKRGGNHGEGFTLKIPINETLTCSLWYRMFDVDLSATAYGEITVQASVQFNDGRGSHTVYQDNLPGLSHAPFAVHLAADPLPKIEGWEAGELHTHTEYGCDQVEFGAPLQAIQRTAEALGLGWVGLTDHSYNLDDMQDDYLHNDPYLVKWSKFKDHVDKLNGNDRPVTLVPGEELTCRSAAGKNVHMLLLGESGFLPGSGDSAEKWLKTMSELSVEDALQRIGKKSFAAAAHPFAPTPFLERLLVARGIWLKPDLENPGLDGWQILNGSPGSDFEKGLRKWKASIMKGARKYIYGGNDSHGNFNRFRQVKLPMLKLHEHHNHLFGKSTTHVRIHGLRSTDEIIRALKRGQAVVSAGPAIELTILNENREIQSGETVRNGDDLKMRIRYKSTPEFGKVKSIKVFTAGQNSEYPIYSLGEGSNQSLESEYCDEITARVSVKNHIRAVILTSNSNGDSNIALTNPVWIEKQ